MALTKNRPTPFPPGTRLSDHYTVEGLVRLSEGRMFYLANDDRPDQSHRKCWSCECEESLRSASHCVRCGAELKTQRFLISARWDDELFEPYMAYHERALTHPGIVPTSNIFHWEGVLCSVSAWNNQTLMIDEGAPLDRAKLIQIALRGVGLLAFMQHNGIELAPLKLANFVQSKEGHFNFFDLEVRGVSEGRLSPERCIPGIQGLAQVLKRLVSLHETPFIAVLNNAIAGKYTRPMDFGRDIETSLQADEVTSNTPLEAAMSDVGLLRVLNEDNWGWIQMSPEIQLYVAADGMGGHECGEVASQMAVDTICREAFERLSRVNSISPETLENVLDESFQAANNGIKDHSEKMGNDMGTTLTAAIIYNNELALVANVGDSRGYLMRDDVLHQITRDHSLVARMVEQNRLNPEEARNHPHSNILLRTVGTERNVEIDIFSVELEKGDQLLLCSDGLWGEIEDEDIEAILNHYSDPRIICREMIRAAHHGGGRDNITVVMVEIP